MADRPTPEQEVRRLYEDAETRTAQAMEAVVGRQSFGELLAMVTDNVVALTRVGNDTWDLVLRNMRVAGRQDITKLARQLARTEDKLELVLQQIETLRDELADGRAKPRGGSSGNARGRGQARESPNGRSSSRRSTRSRSS
jgi:hypothetical protein